MHTNAQLKECFMKLGYNSDFPSSLHINPETSLLWKQFIDKVKPRSEVDSCRKNIIIDRLQKKSAIKDPLQCPVVEIKVYNELKDLKNKISRIKTRIREKHDKENSLRDSNRMNYLLISSLRERIENQRMEVHTLSLKSESIKEEVEHIQKLINVKPLESISEELNPSESVMNILQNLVEKIEKTKPIQNNYAFSSKHNISNILPFKKTCKSTIKKNVTSIKKFGNCTNINLARSLFGDSFKTTENAVIDRMEELASPNQSAELLPESCFNFRSDDEFLIPFQTSYPLRNSKVDCNDDLLGNENIFENTIDQTKSLSKRKRDYFETIHLNNYVKQTVEEIFEGANRRFIWASICALRENLLRDIELGIAENMLNLSFRSEEHNEDDISKLNFIYTKNNLLSLKSRKRIRKLKNSIREKKSELAEQLGEERINMLKLQLENIKCKAAFQFLQKEMNENKKCETILSIENVNTKISKIEEDLLANIEEVENYAESRKNLMQKMKTCQEDIMLCVQKLSKFICYPEWVEGLSENVHLNEMIILRDFSLDFNKSLFFTNQGLFYRDTLKNIILDESTASDIVYMITSLLGHPQNPLERIMGDILRRKGKLKALLALQYPQVVVDQKNYSIQEFQEQDSYIERACEALNSHVRSVKSQRVLNSSTHMKLNMELWLEMPFRRYISSERTVEGKKYKEYEENFNYFKDSK